MGAIAGAALAVGAWLEGNGPAALSLVAISDALTGFLVHNRHPARIFMGDAGSLPIGFLVAALGYIGFREGGEWYAVPAVVALGVPLLDLVTAGVRRTLEAFRVVRHAEMKERFELVVSNRPRLFTADGRHIHHRLLSLGLTRRGAVLIMYGVGAIFAVLAVASGPWRELVPIAFVLFSAGLAFMGSRWLYKELRVLRRGVLLPLFDARFSQRRIVRMLFDALVFGGAFLLAHAVVEADWPGLLTGRSDLLWGAAMSGAVGAFVFWAVGVYQYSVKRAGPWVVSRTSLAVVLAMLIALSLETLVLGGRFHLTVWLLTIYFGGTARWVPASPTGCSMASISGRGRGAPGGPVRCRSRWSGGAARGARESGQGPVRGGVHR